MEMFMHEAPDVLLKKPPTQIEIRLREGHL